MATLVLAQCTFLITTLLFTFVTMDIICMEVVLVEVVNVMVPGLEALLCVSQVSDFYSFITIYIHERYTC